MTEICLKDCLSFVEFEVRRWVDDIKINLKEIGWDGSDSIELAQAGTCGGLL
jgi:hypothetical protein